MRLYEFAAKTNPHKSWDMISTYGVNCNALVSSILLLFLDPHIQKSAIELLGIEKWSRERIDCKMNNIRPKVKNSTNSMVMKPEEKQTAAPTIKLPEVSTMPPTILMNNDRNQVLN